MLMSTISSVDDRNGRIHGCHQSCTFFGMTNCCNICITGNYANCICNAFSLGCRAGIGGVLIYIIAKKKYSHSQSTLWMSLYLFHPVILIDSSIWGQCDSVLAFFGLLFCYFITEKKLIPSYFVFAVGILMKPQKHS